MHNYIHASTQNNSSYVKALEKYMVTQIIYTYMYTNNTQIK